MVAQQDPAGVDTVHLQAEPISISYQVNEAIGVDEFITLLVSSGLGERRPIGDRCCIEGMLQHSNLIVSARHNDRLVGIARSLTDFHYACYLSDLAVAEDCKHRGIGMELQRITQSRLGSRCKIILLAAPQAQEYYPRIGYHRHQHCWIVAQTDRIGRP